MLSAYPCADEHSDYYTSGEINIEVNHDNHSHQSDNDLCSPFCVCNCCGQQTLTFLEIPTFHFLVRFQEIKSSISFYKSTSFSNFYGSIWQPPQIA